MQDHLFDLNAKLERTHWWYSARANVIRKLAETVLPAQPLVVEVGCGTGGLLAALPEAWRRVGVDPSTKAIDLGRGLYPKLDLRVGTAPQTVQEELSQADLVLICDVLEHVEDDEGLFAEIDLCLKVGGQILLTVPAHPKLWTIHDVTHGHFRRYTLDRLELLWRTSGDLELRLLSPFNWRLFPFIRLARLASRLTGKAIGPGSSDLFLPPHPINQFLRFIFSSEQKKLMARVDAPEDRGHRSIGVSWIALLRKRQSGQGEIREENTAEGTH